MEKLIEVLRRLADGARGPLVHDVISELEVALGLAEPPQAVPAAGPEPVAQAPQAAAGDLAGLLSQLQATLAALVPAKTETEGTVQ